MPKGYFGYPSENLEAKISCVWGYSLYCSPQKKFGVSVWQRIFLKMISEYFLPIQIHHHLCPCGEYMFSWLVVSTHLKNITVVKLEIFPHIGVILFEKNWNHHLVAT